MAFILEWSEEDLEDIESIATYIDKKRFPNLCKGSYFKIF
jgi:plasmid stabilization system protein ParE